MKKHQLYVHLPLSMYRKYRDAVLARPTGLELLVDHESLAPGFRPEVEAIAAELQEAKIPCRFHAPFRDLHPAGHDPEAVDLARRRFEGALELAPLFGVRTLVAHPAWDPQGDALDRAEWLERATVFWTSLMPALDAAGAKFALENTFDRDPSLLAELLERLDPDHFVWLFDAGHFNAYSTAPLSEWFTSLGPRLQSFHIHDNGGVDDEHLALGRGNVPWEEFFRLVAGLEGSFEWTIENRSIEDILAGLQFLAARSGLEDFAALTAPHSGGGIEKRRSLP